MSLYIVSNVVTNLRLVKELGKGLAKVTAFQVS